MTDTMPAEGSLILIIEDDNQIRRFLRATLTGQGYRWLEAPSAQEGIRLVSLQYPDLIILDLGLPDLDGLKVIQQIREWTSTPIIVLSVRDQDQDKITAFDHGADDYLTKPFSAGELLARIRVALRHAMRTDQSVEDPVFSVGALRVDQSHRQVFVDDAEVHLTPIEYKLLTTLVRYAGKVVTRDMLLKEVWGPGYAQESHYLRIYVGQLRRKLEADPARPEFLITVPGVGYRLRAE
ncbi:MAG TPA: response regulator [Aggregatilineales bacterium]|nr:response regulator [Aggregatilineales bacterium]